MVYQKRLNVSIFEMYEHYATLFEESTNDWCELKTATIEFYDRSSIYHSPKWLYIKGSVSKNDVEKFNHYIDNVLSFLDKMRQFRLEVSRQESKLRLLTMNN